MQSVRNSEADFDVRIIGDGNSRTKPSVSSNISKLVSPHLLDRGGGSRDPRSNFLKQQTEALAAAQNAA
ncbi:MAG: hypothetical protein WCC64_05395 [Aliidongia sp.]